MFIEDYGMIDSRTLYFMRCEIKKNGNKAFKLSVKRFYAVKICYNAIFQEYIYNQVAILPIYPFNHQ